MYVLCCRRCGATEITETEVKSIECAGETVHLCPSCFEQFRTWFFAGSFPEEEPALTSESPSRAR